MEAHPPEGPAAAPAGFEDGPVTAPAPSPTGPAAAAMPEPVGFWRRAWAFSVDSLLLWFPLSLLKVGLGLPVFDTDLAREADGRDALMFLASAFAHWLYTAALDSSRAQGTLGKQLLGIRAERADGARLSFARASVRQLASWVSWATLGLGFLMCLWTRRRQSLHDWIAGAVLVRWESTPHAGSEARP